MIDSPLIDAPRSRRPIWLAAGVVVVVALLVVVLVWFQPHKLVVDDTVSEPLPGLDSNAAGASGGAPAVVPPEEATSIAAPATTMAATDDTAATAVPTTAAPPETTAPMVDDMSTGLSSALTLAAQSGAPQIAAASEFISLDHGTTGTALLVALPDGGVTLRFEDLDTSNGPDLYVVLTPHAADSGDYDGRLQLGRLKGNRGDQNYDIPPGTDLTAFRSVVIWCERFSSPFGAASVEIM
jgi:hypothetical protein